MDLELGCGMRPSEGFIHHDRINHSDWVDVAHDLNELPWPWESESVERIRAIDVMEHLTIPVKSWLAECWRILMRDGILALQVPHWQHQNAWTDPTHQRAFAERTFDYWDPEKKFYSLYGVYDHANDGRVWRICDRQIVHGNLCFVLQKRGL